MEGTKHSPAGSSRRFLWISISLLAFAAIFFILRDGHSAEESSLSARSSPGDIAPQAPEFRLQSINGRAISLTDFRGKVVILDFWATWCPPCRREIPDFIALQSQYEARGLQIVGIALDEPDKVKGFAQSAGMNYPVLLGDDDIAKLYGGISGIPTTFLIDRSGKVAGRYEGFTSKEEFEAAIRPLL
jgi:cytochrome c biogenesis protein CcmG/thiol:disulfide interchange protein DsbE